MKKILTFVIMLFSFSILGAQNLKDRIAALEERVKELEVLVENLQKKQEAKPEITIGSPREVSADPTEIIGAWRSGEDIYIFKADGTEVHAKRQKDINYYTGVWKEYTQIETFSYSFDGAKLEETSASGTTKTKDTIIKGGKLFFYPSARRGMILERIGDENYEIDTTEKSGQYQPDSE